MLSVSNGKYILKYSALEYQVYLSESPSKIIRLLLIYARSD